MAGGFEELSNADAVDGSMNMDTLVEQEVGIRERKQLLEQRIEATEQEMQTASQPRSCLEQLRVLQAELCDLNSALLNVLEQRYVMECQQEEKMKVIAMRVQQLAAKEAILKKRKRSLEMCIEAMEQDLEDVVDKAQQLQCLGKMDMLEGELCEVNDLILRVIEHRYLVECQSIALEVIASMSTPTEAEQQQAVEAAGAPQLSLPATSPPPALMDCSSPPRNPRSPSMVTILEDEVLEVAVPRVFARAGARLATAWQPSLQLVVAHSWHVGHVATRGRCSAGTACLLPHTVSVPVTFRS